MSLASIFRPQQHLFNPPWLEPEMKMKWKWAAARFFSLLVFSQGLLLRLVRLNVFCHSTLPCNKGNCCSLFSQHPMEYSSLNGKLYGLSKDYGSDTKWFCFLKPTWQQKMLCIFQRERCLMQMSYNGDLNNDQMVLLLNLDLFLTAVRKVRPAHQAPVCWTLINIAMHKMHKMHKSTKAQSSTKCTHRKVRPAHWAPVCPTLSSTINIAMH